MKLKSDIKLILKKTIKSQKKSFLKLQNLVFEIFQIKNTNDFLNFDNSTLPYIDTTDYSFEVLNKSISPYDKLPYDLEKKLNHFREFGYVILENILPQAELNGVWDEIEYITENHQNYDIKGLAHRFNDQKETPIKLIPKDKLKGIGTRFIDYHDSSVRSKKLITHPSLATFLKAVLTPKISVFQSLIFKYSSQQDLHQDFPWVTTKIPSHLVAAWIPFEDVHEDAGPLFYYPKSHRMPKFNFGETGILYGHETSLFSPDEFSEFLGKTCKKLGLKKEVLLIKKGDVLLWHGALAHGGSPINDSSKTRKSFVVHYSTSEGYPKHRNAPLPEQEADQYNGITIYSDPLLVHQKDIVK